MHAEDDHPDDRAHVDDGLFVPVLVRETHTRGDRIARTIRGRELILGRHRVDGDATTWFYIGDDQRGGWELTAECAAQLAAALTRLLAEERGAAPRGSAVS
ncbi:hypothetical protein AOA12_05350 [Microbacterium sp. No. 7]|nr:hypothetical protein AOA12_05350 [Microbacterium sp. No. 7]